MAVFLDHLSYDSLKESIPTQAFRLGRSLISCGDVAGLKTSDITETSVKVSGFVHSEKNAIRWYKVSTTLGLVGAQILSPECVCIASANMRDYKRPCKHISALLLALIADRDYRNDLEAPKIFARTNMKRFAGAPKKLQSQVDYGLTWPDIIAKIRGDVPKKREYSSNYNKLITTTQVAQPKKKRKIEGQYETYTNELLKSELKSKGMKTSGKKSELIKRLRGEE
jgi:hypothetical protein